MTIAMGWLDYISDWELSLFVFYAVPIMLAVWWVGSKVGMLTAIFCAAVWWVANQSNHPYETHLGYAWAMISRFVFFALVSFSTAIVRTRQEGDAARILMLEERRQLEHDIVAVSEHEQQRIGQDLHDGLCQQLAAIGCAQHLLAEDLQAQNNAASRDALLIEESIHQAVTQARDLARGIFPVHVDRSGLSVALTELAQMTSKLTGVSIAVTHEADENVTDPDVAMHLYRIAQEAVANAVRHGKAKQVTISLDRDGHILHLRIDDNGCGIQPLSSGRKEGMGLRTMRYRAQGMGAILHIEPRPGGGTTVSCRLNVSQSSTSKHHDPD